MAAPPLNMNFKLLSRTLTSLPTPSATIGCTFCQNLHAQRRHVSTKGASSDRQAASVQQLSLKQYTTSTPSHAERKTQAASNSSSGSGSDGAASSSPSSVSRGKGKDSLSPETLAAIRQAAKEHASPNPTSIAESHLREIRYRSEKDLYDISNKKKRTTLTNPETARKIVGAMKGLKDKKDVTVIDLYAGEGLLSEALLELPNVRQVIAVESVPSYVQKIDKLVEKNPLRLHHVALDPFWWDTYGVIEKRGLLEGLKKEPWSQEHSGLVLTGLLPDGLLGERLLIQFLQCIPGEIWLYDYGRFASHFILSSVFEEKLRAKVGDKARFKLAVLLESHTSMENELPASTFEPYNEHFKTYHKTSKAKHPLPVLNKFLPLQKRIVETEEEQEVLEFLARNLFVHRSKPWVEVLKYLAPGCEIIAKNMVTAGHVVNPKKVARDLTMMEWKWMVQAFMAWPFRPTDLEQDDVKEAQEWVKFEKRI